MTLSISTRRDQIRLVDRLRRAYPEATIDATFYEVLDAFRETMVEPSKDGESNFLDVLAKKISSRPPRHLRR